MTRAARPEERFRLEEEREAKIRYVDDEEASAITDEDAEQIGRLDGLNDH